tara:strand:- start:373 stop:480 length:108 start_codon:yes stop_codon:yes gene_type:complete
MLKLDNISPPIFLIDKLYPDFVEFLIINVPLEGFG